MDFEAIATQLEPTPSNSEERRNGGAQAEAKSEAHQAEEDSRPLLSSRLKYLDLRKAEDFRELYQHQLSRPRMTALSGHAVRSNYFINVGNSPQDLEIENEEEAADDSYDHKIMELHQGARAPPDEQDAAAQIPAPRFVMEIGRLFVACKPLAGDPSTLLGKPEYTGYAVMVDVERSSKDLWLVYDYKPYMTDEDERVAVTLDGAKMCGDVKPFDLARCAQACQWGTQYGSMALQESINQTGRICRPYLRQPKSQESRIALGRIQDSGSVDGVWQSRTYPTTVTEE